MQNIEHLDYLINILDVIVQDSAQSSWWRKWLISSISTCFFFLFFFIFFIFLLKDVPILLCTLKNNENRTKTPLELVIQDVLFWSTYKKECPVLSYTSSACLWTDRQTPLLLLRKKRRQKKSAREYSIFGYAIYY